MTSSNTSLSSVLISFRTAAFQAANTINIETEQRTLSRSLAIMIGPCPACTSSDTLVLQISQQNAGVDRCYASTMSYMSEAIGINE
jgi:hypothetical protein